MEIKLLMCGTNDGRYVQQAELHDENWKGFMDFFFKPSYAAYNKMLAKSRVPNTGIPIQMEYIM